MISCFNNIKSPLVAKEVDIYEFIEQVKEPNQSVLDLIIKARTNYGKDKYLYDKIKEQLPCFTLNFSFHNIKANGNIKAPTGFIYLDLDNKTDIDLANELIFVSWKSLSNNGRGVLVKVEGLTKNNFKNTYLSIAKELNIEADKNANKPSQYCIHSYDKDIYLNNDSITWECKDEIIKNTPTKGILLKGKKDRAKKGVFTKLRFNNIDDYDFKGKDYLYFEDKKEAIAEVFIRKRITKGNRNNVISSIASQIKALNLNIPFDDFRRLLLSVNFDRCKPPLKGYEIDSVIEKVFKNKENKLFFNSEKRFLFNPQSNLTKQEKTKITAPIMGERRSDKTVSEIKEVLNKWDRNKHGKVTLKTLIIETGKCKNTIEKYYKNFKELRAKINNDLKPLAS